MKTIKMRRFESTGRARKVTPRMMEYLGHVIDTPLEGNREEKNGYVTDVRIGKKMGVTGNRVGHYRWSLARFTKEEIRELCAEVMKEAA